MHHLIVIKIKETKPDSKQVNHHHYYIRMENENQTKFTL